MLFKSIDAIVYMEKLPKFDSVKRADGTSEFEEFLVGLPKQDRVKLLAMNKDAYN